MRFFGYDFKNAEAREEAIALLAFMREQRVKEYTDEQSRKVVLDLPPAPKAR